MSLAQRRRLRRVSLRHFYDSFFKIEQAASGS
jgi:hypothetical protein